MAAMGEDADELAAEAHEEGAEEGAAAAEKGADETVESEDLETNLQRFFKKVDAAVEAYKSLSDERLAKIKVFRDNAVKKMSEDKDISAFNKTKLEADADELLSSFGLKKWSESKKIFPEVTDYVDDIVDHKGYRDHKDAIEKLREGMKAGTLNANKVIAELEALDAANPSTIPLHWMWAEEQDVGFEEDEKYLASITPEEEAQVDIDQEGHQDMPLDGEHLPQDAPGGDVTASTGSVPPDLATIPPPDQATSDAGATNLATIPPGETKVKDATVKAP
jgi:hypothetical protein